MRDICWRSIVHCKTDHLIAHDKVSVQHECLNNGSSIRQVSLCFQPVVLFGWLRTDIRQHERRSSGIKAERAAEDVMHCHRRISILLGLRHTSLRTPGKLAWSSAVSQSAWSRVNAKGTWTLCSALSVRSSELLSSIHGSCDIGVALLENTSPAPASKGCQLPRAKETATRVTSAKTDPTPACRTPRP